MAAVEIIDITGVRPDPELLWGANLDAPRPASASDLYCVEIAGWALGKGSPAVGLRVLVGDTVTRLAHLVEPRPDVGEKYPAVPGSGRCGFRTAVSTVGISPTFELRLQIVLKDGGHLPWAVIRGRHTPPRSTFRPQIQPLMLTTLGRTGSTWLTRLLGQHPQIVTYRPFELEPRVGSYWMDILRDLSEPASYRMSVNPTEISGRHWWLGGTTAGAIPPVANNNLDPEIRQWLGRDSVEALLAFFQGRIEAFYQQVAVLQGRTDPMYFAEKYLPNLAAETVCVCYPDAREIILVRDFRDMICSIFSFTDPGKLGYGAFGRHRAEKNEDYIQHIRNSAVALLEAWEKRSDRAHLLRYEDLIRQPEEALRSALDYLHLESGSDTIGRMLDQAKSLTPELQAGHKTSGGGEASIGRWQRDMDRSMRAACSEAFQEILSKFGYTEL